MTYPQPHASGVEGPGPMVFTSAGWVAASQPMLGDQDLTAVATPTLVSMFLAGNEPDATRAAREIARRFVRATAT